MSFGQRDGGPAFPTFELEDRWVEGNGRHEEISIPTGGMSLRDYFAAKAMQGFYASGKWGVREAANVAPWSYEIADAMLRAREAKS